MRRVFLIVCCAASAAAAAPKPLADLPTLVLTHVTVLDVRNGSPDPDMTVVITGNRIAALTKTGGLQPPSGARVIDATGDYLMPGLWDMHVHLFNNASRPGTDNHELYFPLFVATGVTGTRDMWTTVENLALIRRWRGEVTAGRLVAPRIVGTSTILDGDPPQWPHSIALSSPGQARHVVDSLAAGGVQAIKVLSRLRRDVYYAIRDQATEQHLPVVGHVPESVTAAEASDAGQKSVEHLYGIPEGCSATATDRVDVLASLDRPVAELERLLVRTYRDSLCDALFARFVRNSTWHVPTLIADRGRILLLERAWVGDTNLRYVSRAEREGWERSHRAAMERTSLNDAADHRQFFHHLLTLIGRMRRDGVLLMSGTDVGNPFVVAGFSLHEELKLLVEAGLSPAEAIRAATLNPATFLGATDSLGTVETGKVADLVLLDANPLADVRNTLRIQAVVLNGRYLDRQDLDTLLATVATSARTQ
jgi:imidazolonepropionase-like amidohydrolase